MWCPSGGWRHARGREHGRGEPGSSLSGGYAGGMVDWGWCSQVCAFSELQCGALREGGGTREAGSTVAESLVVLYRVGTHQIRRRRSAVRSSTSRASRGRAEPLCARIKGANRDVSEGKADS